MKIIDETKVKNEISKIEKVVNGKLSTAFEKGVEFAETELETLAIEFAKYCHVIGYVSSMYIDSDLFKRFIERRNEEQ